MFIVGAKTTPNAPVAKSIQGLALAAVHIRKLIPRLIGVLELTVLLHERVPELWRVESHEHRRRAQGSGRCAMDNAVRFSGINSARIFRMSSFALFFRTLPIISSKDVTCFSLSKKSSAEA